MVGTSMDSGKAQAVVAIDRDKNSLQAVKWTVDHLLVNNYTIVFLHVRRPSINSHYGFAMAETTDDAAREQFEAEMNQLFQPYRGFCVKKGVQVREVVLEDMDISKAIVDYIATNKVHNVVLGASSRNAITRKFKNPDVPSTVAKSAPDFCTVYVISKGKQVSVRSAKSSAPANPTPVLRQAQPVAVAPSNHLGSDDSIKL